MNTREEFERWHSETYGVKPSFNRDHDGSRRWDGDKDSRGESWQACQALNDKRIAELEERLNIALSELAEINGSEV